MTKFHQTISPKFAEETNDKTFTEIVWLLLIINRLHPSIWKLIPLAGFEPVTSQSKINAIDHSVNAARARVTQKPNRWCNTEFSSKMNMLHYLQSISETTKLYHTS